MPLVNVKSFVLTSLSEVNVPFSSSVSTVSSTPETLSSCCVATETFVTESCFSLAVSADVVSTARFSTEASSFTTVSVPPSSTSVPALSASVASSPVPPMLP